jgi:WD40 repeat protein
LLAILQGHSDIVASAQFSPDGQRIVTASYDRTARVWNAVDGRLLAILQGHTSYVQHANFSPDGKHIVTTSYDQTARVWEVLTLDDVSRILGN